MDRQNEKANENKEAPELTPDQMDKVSGGVRERVSATNCVNTRSGPGGGHIAGDYGQQEKFVQQEQFVQQQKYDWENQY